MENASLILAISMMAPLAMMLFIFRGRSRIISGFLLVGIFTALFAGEIDGYILSASDMNIEFMTENVTPITEELLKAMPIVFFAFLFKPERQLLVECSISVGIGFALLENVFLYSQNPDASIAWALIRGCGSGLMHAVCTLAIGYAMSFVIEKHKLFFTGSLAALSVSVMYHSVYNIIVQSDYSILGILLPVITYIPILIYIGKKNKKGETK